MFHVRSTPVITHVLWISLITCGWRAGARCGRVTSCSPSTCRTNLRCGRGSASSSSAQVARPSTFLSLSLATSLSYHHPLSHPLFPSTLLYKRRVVELGANCEPLHLSQSLSLSLSLSIYLCISLSLYLSLSLSLSISLSPSLNLSLTHAPSLSHPLSLSPAAATLPRGVAEYSRFRNAA